MRRVPSELGLRVALAIVALAGLGVSGYLTIVRFSGDVPACVVGGGCGTVQKSEYSELAGIPVAVLGLAAYAGLLLAAILPGQLGRALGLFTALVGVGFSGWLTYAELFIIEAICTWCVTSAVLITLALVIAAMRAVGPASGGPRESGHRLESNPLPSKSVGGQ